MVLALNRARIAAQADTRRRGHDGSGAGTDEGKGWRTEESTAAGAGAPAKSASRAAPEEAGARGRAETTATVRGAVVSGGGEAEGESGVDHRWGFRDRSRG